jgi:hypothetical protein
MREQNVLVNSIVTFVAVNDLAGAPMNHHILYCNFILAATAAVAVGTDFEMVIKIDNSNLLSATAPMLEWTSAEVSRRILHWNSGLPTTAASIVETGFEMVIEIDGLN